MVLYVSLRMYSTSQGGRNKGNRRIDMSKKNVGVTARSRYCSATGTKYGILHPGRQTWITQHYANLISPLGPHLSSSYTWRTASCVSVTASCVTSVPDNMHRTDYVAYTAGPRKALSGTNPTSDGHNACADGTHLHQNSANRMKQQATH